MPRSAYNDYMNNTATTEAELDTLDLDAPTIGKTYIWTYRKTSHTVTVTAITDALVICTDSTGFEIEINR